MSAPLSPTGPPTPEGKARSSQNARKHNFTPENFTVIRLENLDALANIRADLIACYRPVNSQELFAIDRIALAQISLLRCAAIENGLLTACLNETINSEGLPQIFLSENLTRNLEVTRNHNRNYCLAEGFTRLTRNPKAWTLFLRYQAQSERIYRRGIDEFERLKALRPELPDETPIKPVPNPQPQENKPTPPSETKSPEAPAEPRPAASAPSPIATEAPKITAPPPLPSPRCRNPVSHRGKHREPRPFMRLDPNRVVGYSKAKLRPATIPHNAFLEDG